MTVCQEPSILVSPLDWGLGHAARCIPIVNELIIQGWTVSLAGSGHSLSILRKEFPRLPAFSLKGYDIFYHSATGNLGFTIARQIPKIWAAIRHEHRWLQQALTTHRFNAVLSDNRYGLHAENVHSVFMTHQLAIRSGMHARIDRLLQRLNYRYIHQFNECWIPDLEGATNIAGELSHPPQIPSNASYIGPLSRFTVEAHEKKYDIAIVLSGPEPSRSIWENKLLQELNDFNGRVFFVRGITDKPPVIHRPNVQVENMVAAGDLNKIIQQSEWVICRSGYTSVMDLIRLRKKAILVPTPGQPEQEYLAGYLHSRGVLYAVPEKQFSLKSGLSGAALFPFNFTGLAGNADAYKERVALLTKTIRERIAKPAAL